MAEVYGLSQLGRDKLQGGATKLSAPELEFLIRVDGSTSLDQIGASMPGVSEESFRALSRRMVEQGLLVAIEADRMALQMQASLDQLALSPGKAAADLGFSSLQNAGFFVEIARQRTSPCARMPGQRLTAVVVEDEPTLAKFISSYLNFEGFEVRLASNRSQIVAEFSKPPVPDVVLLDVLLPDADGFHVLHRLRQHKDLSAVPIILLTGKATRESVLKGMAAGADGYVTKPFEADALMRAVRTVVGLPQDGPPEREPDPWANRDPGTRKR